MCLLILKVICVLFIMSADGSYLNLKDGSECTWNNVQGTCVDYRRCSTYEADVDRYRSPPICTHHGENPVICCTACDIYNLTFGIERQEERNRLLGRTGVKHYDKCIQTYNDVYYPCKYQGDVPDTYDKVFRKDQGCYGFQFRTYPKPSGGVPAEKNEFPHIALLGYAHNLDVKSAQWLCGGTLISEQFILTAAHCKSDPIAGDVQYVGLGMLRRSDPISTWDTYLVFWFFEHPDYTPSSKYNDIALVQTFENIKFKESVLPACLAGIEDMKVYNYLVKSEDTASATGWGALGHRRDRADVLQKVELQRFDELECAAQFPPRRNLRAGYNHSTQMCYGDRDKPRDTCSGDSGGPLHIRSAHADCLFVVLGVTSYGGACGFTGSAGVYTRVRDYVPWIENKVWSS